MPIYKPTELNLYLQKLGISPKKRLSQNFLIDGNIIHKIVVLAEASSEDTVLEIGPGPGALTEALLQTGAAVIAVEMDTALANGLERLQRIGGELKVFNEDILEFALDRASEKNMKVIANLPYHLTTPIMSRLIAQRDHISHVIVMVQEEVARRFTASPGTKDYGSLTVFLNFYSRPEYGFKVSRNCFYPRPNVDSAVVKFTLKPPSEGISEERFFTMTRTAFGQRRKMLNTTLGKMYPGHSIQDILSDMGLPPKSRPEDLSLDQFLELFKILDA